MVYLTSARRIDNRRRSSYAARGSGLFARHDKESNLKAQTGRNAVICSDGWTGFDNAVRPMLRCKSSLNNAWEADLGGSMCSGF